MQSKHTQFIIAVVIQVTIIVAIIIFKFSILAGGTDVILRIQPIDPRDPLRGDFFTFQYDIATISEYQFSGALPKVGDTVYVPLYKSHTYWTVSNGVSKTKPSDGSLFLKGTVMRVGSAFDPVFGRNRNSNIIIEYGLEQYYIPEGTGLDVRITRDSFARIAVDDNGNAVLKTIYIDGEAFNPTGLEAADELPPEFFEDDIRRLNNGTIIIPEAFADDDW